MGSFRWFSEISLPSVAASRRGLAAAAVTLLLAGSLSGCGPNDARRTGGSAPPPPPPPSEPSISSLGPEVSVDVQVNPVELGHSVAPTAFGIHGSVYDNALHDPAVPDLLRAAGITLIRWPGGGYSDNYHWATHTLTPFRDGSPGYRGPNTNFGSFISALESFGTQAMITVNYGSNQRSDGPGEPLEAAAWVAYANGDPSSEQVLGVDGTGFDWQTVGFWAALRASEPLETDDGKNFLRIAHPAPLEIRYWEIGNELFGNGYYAAEFELDLHAPYDAPRLNHPDLSPSTYGRGVVAYAAQMKAVDPSIRIGAVLNTPPMDYSWGPDWNEAVLKEAGDIADFLIVHWYPNGSMRQLLNAPRQQVPAMMEELRKSMAKCCPARASEPEITVTEMGPNSGVGIDAAHAQLTGLFAVDGYSTLLEHGVVNIDWLELHNGSFLSERSQRLGPAYKGIQMVTRFAQAGDTFVTSSSSVPYALRSHAAVDSDGTLSVLLVNLAPASVATVNLAIEGGLASARAERWDYRPMGEAGDGEVTGPVEVESEAALRVEVNAYSALVLVFHPDDAGN